MTFSVSVFCQQEPLPIIFGAFWQNFRDKKTWLYQILIEKLPFFNNNWQLVPIYFSRFAICTNFSLSLVVLSYSIQTTSSSFNPSMSFLLKYWPWSPLYSAPPTWSGNVLRCLTDHSTSQWAPKDSLESGRLAFSPIWLQGETLLHRWFSKPLTLLSYMQQSISMLDTKVCFADEKPLSDSFRHSLPLMKS